MKTKSQVTTEITVTIHGQSFKMTPDEAKALKAQLEAAIPEKEYFPCPYPVPTPLPWDHRPWPYGRTPDIIWTTDGTHWRDRLILCNGTGSAPPMTRFQGSECSNIAGLLQ